MINYQEHIEINPETRFGKPILKGTRISVYDVLNWLANGMTINEIITDFPEFVTLVVLSGELSGAVSKSVHVLLSFEPCNIKLLVVGKICAILLF